MYVWMTWAVWVVVSLQVGFAGLVKGPGPVLFPVHSWEPGGLIYKNVLRLILSSACLQKIAIPDRSGIQNDNFPGVLQERA